MEIARAVVRSWETCFQEAFPVQQGPELPEGLACRARIPEGFLHYALYVEGYVQAARTLPSGIWQVVGVRSVGTTLAAIVAAVLGSPVPITVRPLGHPFRRVLSKEDVDRLPSDSRVVVVDEGPGLSGSSLIAVADALETRGCTVHLIPGHPGGPGWAAGEGARARWEALRRTPVETEAVLAGAGKPDRSLRAWLEECLPPVEALEDVSAGRWQARLAAPVDAPRLSARGEQLKLLATAGEARWLLKFTGLGRWGTHRFELGRVLAQGGWTPPPLAQVHGFTVTPWLSEARPYSLRDEGISRPRAIGRAAEYLAFRAVHCPAPADIVRTGLLELWRMAVENSREALGSLADGLEIDSEVVRGLVEEVRAVAQDGRLQTHEWILTPGGTLLKTDATEHHLGHDVVGPQDIAWDVAGLEAEWELDAGEVQFVERVLERRTGRRIPSELLDVYRIAYRAFRLGQLSLDDPLASRMRELLAAAVQRWIDGPSSRIGGRMGPGLEPVAG
jgi:hypothetical protein